MSVSCKHSFNKSELEIASQINEIETRKRKGKEDR